MLLSEKVLIFAASEMTIQVSFLRGQAVYVTTHFKAALECGFTFYRHLLLTEAVHHHLQETLAAGNVALDGNLLVASKYQDFNGTG